MRKKLKLFNENFHYRKRILDKIHLGLLIVAGKCTTLRWSVSGGVQGFSPDVSCRIGGKMTNQQYKIMMVFGILIPSLFFAQNRDSLNVRLIGSYHFSTGYGYDLCVLDTLAYVDAGTKLSIINVSNPSAPYEVGSCGDMNNTYGIHVVGDYAYIADWFAGVHIVNVANPAAPYEVSCYNTPGRANDVYVSGSYAYVADGDSGLRIINVSDPSAPYEVGHCDTPAHDAYGVYVLGSYAYVADCAGGLRIINVSIPSSPYEVGSCITSDWARRVYVQGNYAYIAAFEVGLCIVDISTPSSPYQVSSWDTPGVACDVYTLGNYAYIGDVTYSVGLRISNISNPSAPSQAGYYDTQYAAFGVYALGNYVYVVAGDFLIFEFYGIGVMEEVSPSLITELRLLKNPTKITLNLL